jgi:ribonuclease HI
MGYWKINFDSAFSEESRAAGIGVVVRDQAGTARVCYSQKINLPSSPMEVEAQAARATIYFARDLQLNSVEFEGNAISIITTLNSSGHNFSSYGHILEDTLSEARNLSWFNFSHMLRTTNRVTDFLAKKALSTSNKCLWLPPVPQDISHVILSDSIFQ